MNTEMILGLTRGWWRLRRARAPPPSPWQGLPIISRVRHPATKVSTAPQGMPKTGAWQILIARRVIQPTLRTHFVVQHSII